MAPDRKSASHAVESHPPPPRGPGGDRTGPAPDARAARRRRAVGLLATVGSALCFGSMPLFARAAYADGVDTPTLLFLRFGISAALLWPLFLLRRQRLPGRRGLLLLVAMGGLGYAGQSFSYFFALTMASAGLVALLLYLFPALVAILGRVLFRAPLSRLQIGAILLALLGSALTIGRAGDGRPLGIFFGVLAATIYAGYILTGSRLPSDVTASASTTVIVSSAGAVYALVGAVRGLHLPQSAAGWGAILGIALLGTVSAIALFLAGLARIGPVRASVYSTVEPVFTLLLAALFLGERVTPGRVAGGAMILAAVVLLARSERAG